ncbi:MAG: ABC transporter ATP-binding protein [Candidatus Limnocylindrales bacterium]
MSGSELELRDLTLHYGSRLALDSVDLRISAGELVCLLGPNGAGKSTLLRAITGTARASAGTVLIDGVPLAEYDRPSLARRMAVVPGQTVVAFPLRVEELVGLGRIPHENPLLGHRPADRVAIDHAIERVGIAHLRGRDVRELSLGERQLVVLAMTIAQGARLLLLDEPTVHLDLRHQIEVMELLRDLAQKDGVTVLAVLHDIGLASHFFPRVLLIAEGRIVADGSPRAVLTPERLRTIFGVDPRFISIAAEAEQTRSRS